MLDHEYHCVDIDNIYQTLDEASSSDHHECRHRHEVQRHVEELAGKVKELCNTREEGHCCCHDNGEPCPSFTILLLDLEEFGTCVVRGATSSDKTNSAENPLPVRVESDEKMVVEVSLNIDDAERAALEAVNGEEYNIINHVRSGDAEEPSSDYWVQVLPPAPRGQGSTSHGIVSGQRARHGRHSPYTRPVIE